MLQLQKVLGKEDRPHKDLINTMAKHMDVIDQKVNTVADSPPQPLDSTHSQKIADLETQVDTLDLEVAKIQDRIVAPTLPTEKPATKKNEEDTDMREKKEGSQPRRDKDDKAKKHVTAVLRYTRCPLCHF